MILSREMPRKLTSRATKDLHLQTVGLTIADIYCIAENLIYGTTGHATDLVLIIKAHVDVIL